MSQTPIDAPRICSKCGLKFLSHSLSPFCLLCRDPYQPGVARPDPPAPSPTVEDCIRVQKMGPGDVLLIRLPKQASPHQATTLVQQCERHNIRCVVLWHDVEAQLLRPVTDPAPST